VIVARVTPPDPLVDADPRERRLARSRQGAGSVEDEPPVRAVRDREAGEAWQDLDLVFCTPVGAPIDSRDDWAEWRDLLAQADVRPARVHDARHTAATLLLEQKVDIRVVQQILGYSQLSQTERYTHVTSALSKHAADRMSEALWG
jgi:site-specific recombinase XerD